MNEEFVKSIYETIVKDREDIYNSRPAKFVLLVCCYCYRWYK